MRILTEEIPSDFVRFDSEAFDADAYANVADMQQIRRNHNILLARRCRRPFFQARIGDTTGASGTAFNEVRAVVSGLSACVMSIPYMRSSPYIYSITCAIYGRGRASASPRFYPVVCPVEVEPEIDNSVVLTFDSTSDGWESVEVPVKVSSAESMFFFVHLFAEILEGAATPKTAVTVADVGRNYATGNGLGNAVGEIIYSPTNTDIEPRTVISIQNNVDAAGNDLVVIDRDWNIWPVPGTDTLETRTTSTATLSTVSLWENAITDFSLRSYTGFSW